jgi:hypothetical protein
MRNAKKEEELRRLRTAIEGAKLEPNVCLILCEGSDEKALVEKFEASANLNLRAIVIPAKATEEVGQLIALQIRRYSLTRIGFLFDCEESESNANENLIKLFGSIDLSLDTVPRNVASAALGNRRVAVQAFLCGNAERKGCLDSLFRVQAEEQTELRECVEAFIRCHDYPKKSPSTTSQRDKFFLRAFLAAGNEVNTGIGTALNSGHLTWEHPALEGLVNFLRSISQAVVR